MNDKKISVKVVNIPSVESNALDSVASVRRLQQHAQMTTSETLFAGARELIIAHAGDAYRLRLTNQGKLILTK